MMYQIFVTILVLSSFLNVALTESDLQEKNLNQEHLNPVNDNDNTDASDKNQDKRTIFGPIQNVGWAKHVGVSSSGTKYVIGYGPVDLKYQPVLRPIAVKHTGYRYGKPNIYFRIKKPATVLKPTVPIQNGWTPVAVKPVVPVKPSHVDVIHQNPLPHVDHVHQVPTHVHQVPVQVDHVHQVPAHVDHVHQFQVEHGGHAHNVQHVDHIHEVPHHDHLRQVPHHDHLHLNPVPVSIPAVPQPLLPLPLAPALRPFIPSPTLFEVTKPNLGVLPFGATFPSPIWQSVPTPDVHFKPVLPQPIAPVIPLPPPAVHVSQPAIPIYPPAGPVAQPAPPPPVFHLHQPSFPLPHSAVPQPTFHLPQPRPLLPQPAYPSGTVVEYHGTRNFLPVNSQYPFLPQTPVNAVQPLLPPHFHLQGLPNQHEIPKNYPNIYQQELPVNSQPHFQHDSGNIVQELPTDSGNPNFLQQPLPLDNEPHFQQNVQHYQPDIPNIQHFEQFDRGQPIQPGQTDVQLPLHLPQHPGFVNSGRGFEPGNFHDPTQYPDNVFKPSISLEPPYKKK